MARPPLRLQPIEERRFIADDAPEVSVVVRRAAAASSSGSSIMRGTTPVRYEREGFGDATSPAPDPRRRDAIRSGNGGDRRATPTTAPREQAACRGPRSAAPTPPASPTGKAPSPSGTSRPASNIRWKTPIPGLATSSPIVWGDRVIVVTAASDEDTSFRTGLYGDVKPVDSLPTHSYRVYALDRATGKVVWQREAFSGDTAHQAPHQIEPGQRHAGHRRPPHRRGVRLDRADGLLRHGRHAALEERDRRRSTAAGSSIRAINGAIRARRSSTSRR